ncbi:MAG: RNA polymerase-binding protein DksA, partial [Alphaproteobacteria bacterium TMED110]
MATRLPKDYAPSDSEPFMNARQREYFRRKLVIWKEDIIRETRETVSSLQEGNLNLPDVTDRAAS